MGLIQDKLQQDLLKYVEPESAKSWTDIISSEMKDDKEIALRKAKKDFHEHFKQFEYKDIGQFIFNAKIELEKLTEMYQDLFDKEEDDFLQFIENKFEAERELVFEGGIKGYRLNHLSFYERMCDGLRPGLHYFGAHPNVGKTSLMSTMDWDLLMSNKQVCTMFITIDDTRDKIVNNILACASDRSQNIVDRKRNEADASAVQGAYDKVIGWGLNKRMTVLDSSSFGRR